MLSAFGDSQNVDYVNVVFSPDSPTPECSSKETPIVVEDEGARYLPSKGVVSNFSMS